MYAECSRSLRVATLLAALALLPVACSDSTAPGGGGGGSGGGGGGGGGSGSAASVIIEPGALLLTEAGETMQLEAKVYDASGAPVQADVTWRSNDPGTVSVSGSGLATATAALGSAQITAVAEGVESEPALALVATPAPGVVLVPDAQILSDPEAVDPDAEYEAGWRYRIRVRDVAVDPGQLVIGTGGRSLAGRVVSASPRGSDTELTVEFVPLSELFADLSIDEEFPLVEAEAAGGANLLTPRGDAALRGQPDTEFTLGPFKCKASGTAPSLDLPSPTLTINPSLALALRYANGLETYAVRGTIAADFRYKPIFKAAFAGEVGCEKVLTTQTVPLGGVLAWFVGIQVPIGVGFELDGKVDLAEVGFDVSAHAEASAELGLRCPAAGGDCTMLTRFDTQRDFKFEPIVPNLAEQFKVELGGHGFLFSRPAIGSKFSKKAQFEFLAASAGLKQSVDLAAATRQVKETGYASNFKLAGLIKVGPGSDLAKAIDKLGKWLGKGLGAAPPLVDIDEALATSPKGTFTITPASVEPGDGTTLGDMATFTVDLDPVTYLSLGSVEKVEIFWKKDDGSGGFTLEPGRPGCTDIAASPGQTKFECQTDFIEEHRGVQTFYAFVHAKMFGVPVILPLEVADDAVAMVEVGAGTGYFENFNDGSVGPEWSTSSVETSPSGEPFLGRHGSESVTLNLGDLPAHDTLRIELDLYIIRSWDGNNDQPGNGPDVLAAGIDGVTQLTTTFSNVTMRDDHLQAYPDNYPAGSHPAGTASAATNSLGYDPKSDHHFGDSVYHLVFDVEHVASSLAFTVSGQGLDVDLDDESWGLDNIRVTTR